MLRIRSSFSIFEGVSDYVVVTRMCWFKVCAIISKRSIANIVLEYNCFVMRSFIS